MLASSSKFVTSTSSSSLRLTMVWWSVWCLRSAAGRRAIAGRRVGLALDAQVEVVAVRAAEIFALDCLTAAVAEARVRIAFAVHHLESPEERWWRRRHPLEGRVVGAEEYTHAQLALDPGEAWRLSR